MDLVAGAIGSLVPKLLELLRQEYNLQTRVKKQVQSLARELESAHAFLRKVTDVPWDQLDEQVKLWARDVRETSYDMEDVLDIFLVHDDGVPNPADMGKLESTMNKTMNLFRKLKRQHDISCTIHDIKNQIQVVYERHDRYRIGDIVANPAATTPATDPRLQAMYKEVAHLVCNDKARGDLISKLSSQDDMSPRKKIISIVGTGGLGKTTLAKAVYDKLRVDFDCGAFVSVGRNPDPVKVLMDILYDLDKNKSIPNMQRDAIHLTNNLREFLENKRYFIVIDDIWENKSWETIKLALFENNCGSRIIITTRNSQVATEVGDEVYKMHPLSDDNSKKLFYTRIFGHEGKFPDNQPDEIPNRILKKCDGIPLAIITVASLLVSKPREKWSDVFTSIGFGHSDNPHVENTMKILSYSYYDMPSYLRTCLLYLSVYPEDYTIDKDSLIWRWIAEGFVQRFELGEQYFNDLINRSMIQAIESYGRVEYCRVHDMVLDLVRSMSSKVNFVTVLDNNEGIISPRSSARRLVHHNITLEHNPYGNMVDMAHVRSFIASRCSFDKLAPLSSFKLLRVLAMEGCKNVWPSHLVHLGNLHHLRYLGIESTEIEKLPNEIGALKSLQILNLNGSSQVELTDSISRLTQLVCLKGYPLYEYTQDWIGKLTALEELEIYIFPPVSYHSYLKALGSLRELKALGICLNHQIDESMQKDFVLSLRNLCKLQHLLIQAYEFMETDTSMWEQAGFIFPPHLRVLDLYDIGFSWLPSCISTADLPNLSHLSLHVKEMDVAGLEYLSRLPELIYLKLHMESTAAISNINASNGYFKKLRFCEMPNSMIQFLCKEEDSSVSFHIWNGKDDMPFGSSKNKCSVPPFTVMPKLEVLKAEVFVRALKHGNGDCGNIGLEHLTSLQKVKVDINCEGASAAEVDKAEDALWNATEVHPNRPTLKAKRYNEEEIISDEEPEEEEEVVSLMAELSLAEEEEEEEGGEEEEEEEVSLMAKLRLAGP